MSRRGELIELRPVDRTNLETYLTWVSDPEVTATLAIGARPLTRENEQEFFDRATRSTATDVFWAIHALDDGAVIGQTGLHRIDPSNRSASLGIVIGDKQRWGKGYGTDAVRVLCDYGFAELNLYRIELEVLEHNERGYRAYLKAGFTEEGRRRHAWYRNGAYQDSVVMSVLRPEWEVASG